MKVIKIIICSTDYNIDSERILVASAAAHLVSMEVKRHIHEEKAHEVQELEEAKFSGSAIITRPHWKIQKAENHIRFILRRKSHEE